MRFLQNITICHNPNGCANVFKIKFCKRCNKYIDEYCPRCHETFHRQLSDIRRLDKLERDY